MKKVFLDSLPKKDGKGVNKNRKVIDWENSIGYVVNFIYEDIADEIKIIDYNISRRELDIKYKNKDIFKIKSDNFSNCRLGRLLGKKTSDFKIEIGTIFNDEKRSIVITNRKYKNINTNKGIQLKKMYQYKCNKCGFNCQGEMYKGGKLIEDYWVDENSLLNGCGCPICCSSPKIAVPHINSIVANKETHWMIPYFQGGWDEAKKYCKSSGCKIKPICVECGTIREKEKPIYVIHDEHSIGCMVCGDGVSYPEKFISSVLKQLNVNFISQLSKNHFDWIGEYKYDFYISLYNIIIEADGEFHIKDNTMSGQTKEESQKLDNHKDKLAKENGLKVIRIDCEFSNLEFIKSNILNSELNNIFDLSNIDWNRCEESALSNLCKKACELKRDNHDMSTLDISLILGINRTTAIRYLKKGSDIWNWCNYDAKEESSKSSKKTGKMSAKKIEVFKNNKSLGIFESSTYIEKESRNLFGVYLDRHIISKVAKGKIEDYKNLKFKYAV